MSSETEWRDWGLRDHLKTKAFLMSEMGRQQSPEKGDMT